MTSAQGRWGGWTCIEAATDYATGNKEEADIVESPVGDYHVISPYNTNAYVEVGYKLVAQVRLEVRVYRPGDGG